MSSYINPEDLKNKAQAFDPPPQKGPSGPQHGGQHGGEHGGRYGGGRYRRPRPYPYPYGYPYYGPPSPVAACPAGTAAYTVQPGDSIFSIANRYGIAPESVMAANPGIDFNYLQVGQILCI